MFPPCLGDVFFRATVLAQQSGASEIDIDILLTALDAPEVEIPMMYCVKIKWPNPASLLSETSDVAESGDYALSINSDWTPLSTHAVKALGPFAGIENVDAFALQKALLAAKERK
jgi:hypothetical protein